MEISSYAILGFVLTAALGETTAWVSGRSRYWNKGINESPNVYGCPRLQNPQNGNVQVSGNKATYTCHSNYVLIGNSERKCFCVKWFGVPPVCVADGQWGAWSEWTTCTRSCGTGTQTRRRTCILPDSRGTPCTGSTNEDRNCNTATCPKCPSLIDKNISAGPLTVDILTGSSSRIANVNCIDGYKLVGLENNEYDCLDYELLSRPTCRKICPDLTNPEHGRVRIFGDTAAYECNPGFRIVGSPRRLCASGMWTGVEPNCTTSFSTRGINPQILLDNTKNSFFGPKILTPNCRVTATFQYRVLSQRKSIGLRAIATFVDDLDNNVGDATADVVLPTDTSVTQTSCLSLDCNREETVVGVIEFEVDLLESEIIVMINIQFSTTQPCEVRFAAGLCPALNDSDSTTNQKCNAECITDGDCDSSASKCCFNGCSQSCALAEQRTNDTDGCALFNPCRNSGTCQNDIFGFSCICPAGYTGIHCERFANTTRRHRNADGTLPGNCDSSTSSGDCGYRNSGCSIQPWVLTLVDDTDQEQDVELAPLQYDRESEDCLFHTCIPCLLDSGFTTTSPLTVPRDKRRKRGFETEGKALCLQGGETSPAIGEFASDETDVLMNSQLVEDTELLSFDYKMRSDGIHHMMVYAKCVGLPHYHIQVGQDKTVFGILHLDANGREGRVCVSLRPHVNDAPGFSSSTCSKFRIFVQAAAIGKEVCIEDVQFHSRQEIGQSVCPIVDNE